MKRITNAGTALAAIFSLIFALTPAAAGAPATAGAHSAETARPVAAQTTAPDSQDDGSGQSGQWLRIDAFFDRVTITQKDEGFVVNAMPSEFGMEHVDDRSLWFLQELEAKAKAGVDPAGQPYWSSSIADQLLCHLTGYPFSLPEYNLESWRPDVDPFPSLVRYQCNPR